MFFLCFCFALVPVFDRGRYGIYSCTPFDDDDYTTLTKTTGTIMLFLLKTESLY